jgi:glycine cleavage system H protein
MDSSIPTNKHPLVPPNEQKCVWMSAGILSYQLCDREFDCDHCPLDSALRTFPERTVVDQRQEVVHEKTRENRVLSHGHLYSRKHCWIKSNDGDIVRIGIEPNFASMLLNSKTVVLPSIGDQVQSNKTCAWVVIDGGTLPICSPLDGEVSRTNAALVDEPHHLHDAPYEQGWLFEIKTSEDVFNSSSLLRTAEAERRFGEDQQRFQSLAYAELKKHRANTGVTLADGGRPIQDVVTMLGAEKYFLLLREVFA